MTQNLQFPHFYVNQFFSANTTVNTFCKFVFFTHKDKAHQIQDNLAKLKKVSLLPDCPNAKKAESYTTKAALKTWWETNLCGGCNLPPPP